MLSPAREDYSIGQNDNNISNNLNQYTASAIASDAESKITERSFLENKRINQNILSIHAYYDVLKFHKSNFNLSLGLEYATLSKISFKIGKNF
ncbi:hypothetical protein [Candidatus Ornithobacterium hominis]|uniref:hypothetical protein n=1 Tax=Candidatus Ornithobacterium hominis TaxID=2497989 RepID=UPI000E5B4749|nr:hypothetical protein [Candidatus Ornithobacterium hominis]